MSREVSHGRRRDIEINLAVHVDALDLIHDKEGDPAPQPVVELVIDPRAGQVQRAGLAVAQSGRGQVLSARPGPDSVVRARWISRPPEEGGLGDNADHRVDLRRRELGDRPVQSAGEANRGGGLEQHDGRRLTVGLTPPVQGMSHDRLGRRGVLGQLGWPQEGHERARRARNLGDLVVIGGHQDVHRGRARQGLLDGPHHERLTAEVTQVLSGHPFGAAAYGDHAQHGCHDSIMARTCCAMASAGFRSGTAGGGVGSPPHGRMP